MPVVAVASNSLGGSSNAGQVTSVAVVRGGGTSLYDRPGGTEIEQLSGGTALTASARSTDEEWLVVAAPSGATGWVQIAAVAVSNLQALPIQDPAIALPEASASESAEATVTEAQPTPTAEVTTESAPGQVDAALSIDPNKVVAKVNLTESRLNIRSGPGTEFLVIGKAEPNDTFDVIGRNDAATWVKVVTPDVSDQDGWVSAEFVILSQPISNVPIAESVVPAAVSTAVPVLPSDDISCTTNQIIKWESSQVRWVCSDDLTSLQADVAALRAEVEVLKAEIAALKE
jgi:uncharacterized protein YraI